MTVHEAVLSGPRQLLLPIILLVLTMQLFLVFASFREGRIRRIRLLYLLHAAVSFVFFFLLMLEITWDRNFPGGTRSLPPLPAAFGRLPAAVIFGYGLLSAFLTAAAVADLIRYRKNHLTADSIKETMDLLPAGIAFAITDGTVVFRNVTMDHLSRMLTGKTLTRLDDFRETVETGEKESAGENRQVTVPGTAAVWQIVSQAMSADGEELVQLTATDITTQAKITRELEAKNAKLRELHMRLDIYNRQAERIIIEQETLTARMAVHNALGNILLESRHYLHDPASIDEAVLLQALKNTNTYLLKEYEEDDTVRDPLTDALEMAEAIGVNVSITGIPPAGEPGRGICAAAVAECATNTVKHADGDCLRVEIIRAGEDTIYTLSGNGIPPDGEIRESGGLRSVRALVEKHRGTMKTESTPCFRLIIRLPAGKDEYPLSQTEK